MLTGDLKSKIDQIWNAFWSGGIANPIEVIEQITYLLFLRALDSDQTREENKAARLKAAPVRIYPEGVDSKGRKFDDLRWSRFKDFAPAEMFTVLSEHVFPFLRGLNDANAGGTSRSTFAHHMKDAYPALFNDWGCTVTALELQRTFWEKATILHSKFHRPAESPTPARYARHYFDMVKLLAHARAPTFLADQAQCDRVVNWKSRVFARGWAR